MSLKFPVKSSSYPAFLSEHPTVGSHGRRAGSCQKAIEIEISFSRSELAIDGDEPCGAERRHVPISNEFIREADLSAP
jgi:hypothetical protein